MESKKGSGDFSDTLEALLASNASVEDLTRSLFDHIYTKTLRDDPELAEMMRACAIPTSLDSEVIGVLRHAPNKNRSNKRILSNLSRFNFVITRKDGRFVYHDSTRDILLREWHSQRNRKQYDTYVDRLVRYYYGKARKHRRKKEYQEALANLNLISEFRSNDANLYLQLGITRFELQDYKAALADFTRAINLKPKDSDLYHWRALTYLRLKKNKLAITDYGKAIKLNPGDGMNFHGRGRSYYNLEKYEAAVKDFTAAAKLEPTQALNYHWRGASHSQLKRFNEALKDFTKAVKLNPRSIASYQFRGLVKYELKKYKQALLDFTRATKLQHTDTFSYHWLASTHLALRDHKTALLNFNKAIELDPAEGIHYTARSEAYFGWGQYKEALSDLTKAIRLDPTEPQNYYARGKVKYVQKKYMVSLNDFNKAIDLNPGQPINYFFRALCRIATCEALAALEDLEHAGKNMVRNPQITIWRGIARYSLDHLEEAQMDWRLAKSFATKSDDICAQQRAFGLIALLNNDLVAARKHYTSALSKICDLTALRTELGYLEQLLRIFPAHRGIRDTKDWFLNRLQSAAK